MDQRLDDLTARVGNLEKPVAQFGVVLAEQPVRIDRVETRLGRLEARAERVGAER